MNSPICQRQYASPMSRTSPANSSLDHKGNEEKDEKNNCKKVGSLCTCTCLEWTSFHFFVVHTAVTTLIIQRSFWRVRPALWVSFISCEQRRIFNYLIYQEYNAEHLTAATYVVVRHARWGSQGVKWKIHSTLRSSITFGHLRVPIYNFFFEILGRKAERAGFTQGKVWNRVYILQVWRQREKEREREREWESVTIHRVLPALRWLLMSLSRCFVCRHGAVRRRKGKQG